MKIPSVKGFHDVLPGEIARWSGLEARARGVFAQYNFHEIRIPIVERTELFRRSIGETTDIVEKEMYTFDRSRRDVADAAAGGHRVGRARLRRARACTQHEPVSKLYYFGPMFRRERPQKGRLRQFSQIGAEVLGRDDPAADAEVLLLLHDLLARFGIAAPRCSINSLGDRTCRPAYRDALVAWGAGAPRRAVRGLRAPPRAEPAAPARLQAARVRARSARPRRAWSIISCEPVSRAFRRACCALLAARRRRGRGCSPHMVRGLDYYCRTAFEVIAPGLGAQNAVGGGGRYDGLVQAISAARTSPASASRSASSASCSSMAERRRRRDARRRSSSSRRSAPRPRPRRCTLAHRWRRDGVRVEVEQRRHEPEEPDAARRQARRPLRADPRRGRAGAAARLTVRDMAAQARLSARRRAARRRRAELRDALAQRRRSDADGAHAHDARSARRLAAQRLLRRRCAPTDIGREVTVMGWVHYAARPRRRRVRRPARPHRHRAGGVQPRAQPGGARARRRAAQRVRHRRARHASRARPAGDASTRTWPPARSR